MTTAGARVELRIERDALTLARSRVAAAPTLVFPLETAVVVVRIGAHEERVSRSAFALVPARAAYAIDAPATGAAVVATLALSEAVRAAAVRDYAPDVSARRLAEVLASPRFLTRTRWIDELVHRYVFERAVCARQASKAARFLEVELTKEVYFLGVEQLEHRTRSSVVFEGDALVARARAWIEAHLFEPFRIEELVRHCHASESTLLRGFRRELGASPLAYLRRRRLDESLQLLESGRYAVTEVATRVGYETPSAFAAAFRQQFGMAPSRTRPTIGALPAHGTPPARRPRRRG
ncbi:MAG: AraC family transcriptional regulator [Deltaproteobacteria bacterium]|nr:AraC family transcriptional regulator [Deltaproteobacteria bacterium]